MPMPREIDLQIASLVERYGLSAVSDAVRISSNRDEEVLTIVSNKGLHEAPAEYLHGEIFYATEGPIECEDVNCVNDYLDELTTRLKAKLLEKRWKKVNLIPFGHIVLNMTIKMIVFRSLWIETNDLFYFGNNRYGIIERDTKRILSAV